MVCDLWALVERDLVVVAAGFFGEVVLVPVLCFAAPVFAELAELWSRRAGESA
jgi:hypothetical protein